MMLNHPHFISEESNPIPIKPFSLTSTNYDASKNSPKDLDFKSSVNFISPIKPKNERRSNPKAKPSQTIIVVPLNRQPSPAKRNSWHIMKIFARGLTGFISPEVVPIKDSVFFFSKILEKYLLDSTPRKYK